MEYAANKNGSEYVILHGGNPVHWFRLAITIALIMGYVTPTLVPICYK